MDKEIQKLFRDLLPKINKRVKFILDLEVDKKIRDILNYQIETGGKRIRPILMIVSAKALGGRITDIINAAAGIEILHNFTLIIDDIIDYSILRRGKKTVWTRYGKSIAECLGIDYSASIFQAAVLTNKPREISEIFARTGKKIVEGEILDILFEQKGREDESYVVKNRYKNITLKDYLEMVSKKTAYLFQASCEIGAILTSNRKKDIRALGNYGFNLGMAFQIRDDILDVFGKQTSFGKEIGRDIKDRKLGNIVLNFALDELPLKKRKKIKDILRKERISKKDVREVIKYIKETQALNRAFSLEEIYIEKAKRSLKNLPLNKWTRILGKIANFVMEREK